MLKNLKISKKLLILVLSLLICLAVVGGSSIILMGKMNSASTEISKNWLPSVIIAEEINTMTSDHRIFEADHVLSQDVATMKNYDDLITSKRKQIEDAFDAYVPLITNETDKQLMESARSNWGKYIALSDKMLAVSQQNETEEAMNILQGESSTLFDEVSNTCLQVVEFNKEGADQASANGDRLFTFSEIAIAVILGLAILISIFLATYIVKLITRPLNEIKEATERIAKGELDISISYESNDEVGSMAKSFTGMSLNVKTMVGDIDYLLEEMAQGNFNVTTKNEEVYIGAYQNIILSLRKLRLTLRDTLTQIDDASVQVATSSDQVSSGAQTLSQGAMEQASSIEELAATVNEAFVHIKENAKNAQDANQLVIQAGAGVKGSNTSMKEMISAMGELSSISSEIEKIIKTIDEIAFQTNILALNAAVEAARAGEAGKGFAVVADEVRNLAQKSAEAANTTTMHIGSVLSAIQNSTVIANDTARSLEAVVDETTTAASKMAEIASASEQQAEAISQITIGIDQLSSVVQTNSATAEESAAASEELNGQAHLLQKLVGQFKL